MNQTLDRLVNSATTKIGTAILAGFLGYQTINIILPNNTAYAQNDARASTPERVTIEEYYKRALPRDDLFPGARVGEYRLPVQGVHNGWIGDNWEKTYYENVNGYGDQIRKILAINGQKHVVDFLKNKKGQPLRVALHLIVYTLKHIVVFYAQLLILANKKSNP